MGFGALLLVIGVVGFESIRESRHVAAASAALRKASRDRDALLDQLRTELYHSATLVRDYLSESDDDRAALRGEEVRQSHARARALLDGYEAAIPSEEVGQTQQLRSRVEAYWAEIAPALRWSRAERRKLADGFLQRSVLPRRDELVAVVKQATDLDQRDLDAAEERVAAMQARYGEAAGTVSALALILGVAMAVMAVRHMRRLELEAGRRLSEVRRLTDRLVTAQEEERRSVSRELHDDLGQAMSAMLMELGRLDADDRGERGERVAAVRRMAEEIIAKIRNMALLLRPSMLDELGLVAAIRWHAREVAARTGLKVKVAAEDLDDDLSDALRTGVFRVVQEALNNCVKHARASEARVTIHRAGDGLSVLVEDNGAGFDPVQDKGLGVLGMRERVERLGGRFEIRSQIGRGTTVRARFPIGARPPMTAAGGAR